MPGGWGLCFQGWALSQWHQRCSDSQELDKKGRIWSLRRKNVWSSSYELLWMMGKDAQQHTFWERGGSDLQWYLAIITIFFFMLNVGEKWSRNILFPWTDIKESSLRTLRKKLTPQELSGWYTIQKSAICYLFLPREFHGQRSPGWLQSMGSQRVRHN